MDERIKLEPGKLASKEKYDYEEPSEYSKLPEDLSHYDPYGKEFNNLNDGDEKEQKKEDEEPLFVEDRTRNVTQEIQFESSMAFKNDNETCSSTTDFKQNACWNCNSVNHSLHNCSKPKNQQLINQNRHAFHLQKNQQQRFGGGNRSRRRNLRYFVTDSRLSFSNLIVGKLSDGLLEALGIPKNGIPAHVYKMREIGYPSGWLEEAKEEYSGITIFTAPNEALPHPGGDEFFRCNINAKKLHSYPGFNAPCPPDAIDEYVKYGCPQYDPEQSLSNMVQKLKAPKNDNSLTDSREDNFEDTGFASSYDIFATEDSKIVEEDNFTDSPPSSPEDGEITENEDNSLDRIDTTVEMDTTSASTETNELAVSKKIIDVQNNSEEIIPEESNSEPMVTSIDISESLTEVQSCSSSLIISEDRTPSTSKGVKRKFGDVKSETLGTPVLEPFSNYKTRPNLDKFAKGMVDMIDHENLPHATGAFKNLKELLKDVRKTLSGEL